MQVMVSGNDAITTIHSRFTRLLLDGLRSGSAGGRRVKTNLHDLATYVRPIGDASLHAPTFSEFGKRRQHVIAGNPNHGEQLPYDIMKDLYGFDTGKQAAALERLIRLSGTSPNLRPRVDEVLHRFANDTNLVPSIRSILQGWHSKRETASRRTIGVGRLDIFRTRHTLVANAAREAATSGAGVPRPFDLEQSRDYMIGDVSLIEWIGRGNETLWIIDRNAAEDLAYRDPDILAVLEASPNAQRKQAIYWMEDCSDLKAYEILRCARYQAQSPEPIEGLVAQIEGRSTPANNNAVLANHLASKSVYRDDSLFEDIANENSALLGQQRQFSLGAGELRIQEAVREQKFLLYVQQGRFVLAISDIADHIDDHELRFSYEPRAKARLATEEELSSLGFNDRSVDPMFQDPYGKINRVYIDAAIFFQHLMFPRSLVKVPNYTRSEKTTSEIPISSFIRTLQQLHGERRVVFANITRRRRSQDGFLHGIMEDMFVHTRFAPSPSNSLHLGSLRTALISYLFGNRDPTHGRFHIRFDDTGLLRDVARTNAERVLSDLRWVGFVKVTRGSYYQTDDLPRANYGRVLELLARSGFCNEEEDGSITLKANERHHAICYWLDLKRGPQIRHARSKCGK